MKCIQTECHLQKIAYKKHRAHKNMAIMERKPHQQLNWIYARTARTLIHQHIDVEMRETAKTNQYSQ